MVNDKSFNALPFKWGNYYRLNPVFRGVVDSYYDHEHGGALQEVTIRGRACTGISLFFYLQSKDISTLEMISEESFVSYFILDQKPVISASHRYHLKSFLEVAAEEYPVCKKMLSWMPYIRTVRKNIQYLTDEEFAAIKDVCIDENSCLSYLDRAIAMILMFTGMRSSDVAALELDSIDWESEKLNLIQCKTGMPLELPLPRIVGNAIYEYLCNERQESDEKALFLSSKGRPIYSQIVAAHMSHVYDAAGIRQNKGDRRGTHIFRYRLATKLLENEVPQPVISHTIGHSSPASIQPYLSADMKHLKECALSIEQFPVDWSVIDYA